MEINYLKSTAALNSKKPQEVSLKKMLEAVLKTHMFSNLLRLTYKTVVNSDTFVSKTVVNQENLFNYNQINGIIVWKNIVLYQLFLMVNLQYKKYGLMNKINYIYNMDNNYLIPNKKHY